LIQIKMAWASEICPKLTFVNEIFIKINKRVYYVILVVDSAENILAWELLHKGSSDNILKVINMTLF